MHERDAGQAVSQYNGHDKAAADQRRTSPIGGMAANKVVDRGVNYELDQLLKQVEALAHDTRQLIDRIEPVLRPEPTAETAGKEPIRPGESNVTAIISDINKRVFSIQMFVQHTISRIDV